MQILYKKFINLESIIFYLIKFENISRKNFKTKKLLIIFIFLNLSSF